jgi:acetoin utilization deacetylase AcuC-like enzyme
MPACSVISGEVFARHDIPGHRECSIRLQRALSAVPPGVSWRDPVLATPEDLERVHTPQYVRWLRTIASSSHYLDLNTYVTGESFTVASFAAGSAIAAAERALDGEHCFAIVRPPGHHAERDRAMGYCLLNNAAVAAAAALGDVDRVAIIDWDLHHGNGTQEIFYSSDRVLYCSVHQEGIFPRSGWMDEVGSGRGKGYSINAPLKKGCTIADYRAVLEEVFLPLIRRFDPDLVLISAGQDPLGDDQEGGMELVPEDFATITRLVVEGTDLPLALVLEGGYGPSLGTAVSHIFRALAGAVDMPAPVTPSPPTRQVITTLQRIVL